MEEDSVEEEIQREYAGHVEGLRSIGLDAAKE